MAFVLSIDGSVIDRVASKVRLTSFRPWVRDGIPSLDFKQHSVTLNSGADQWIGKEVTLAYNGTTYFKGDIVSRLPAQPDRHRWVVQYHAEGLRRRGERFGIRDDQTGTDATSFNVPFGEYGYIASRAGRTVGEAIIDVLEGITNSANLAAAGIGNYTSAGTGATAKATVANGQVTGITVTDGGNGYTTAPTVLLVGGGYTVKATAHASVNVGGQVTGISVDTAGSGYLSAPTVLISRLPAATLIDLAALTIIPPFRMRVSGERLISAIEGTLKGVHPNHCVHIQPDGTIRFLDTRNFGGTSVSVSTIGGGTGAVVIPTINPATGAITKLDLVHGGRGYSGAAVITFTGTGTGASGSATIGPDGSIASVSLGSGGSGYAEGRTATFTLGINECLAPEIHEDTSVCFSRVQVTGRPIIEPVDFNLGANGKLEEYFQHDGLDLAGAKGAWKLSDFDQPAISQGAASGVAVMDTAGVDGTTVTITTAGTGYTTSPTVTFSGGGGTGAAGTAIVSGGHVTGITITSAGSGYSTAPSISFSGGGGTGAAATIKLLPRAVASITLLDGGFGYIAAPAVALTGGGGTGASFTANLSGQAVSGFTKVSGGSNYTSAPAVHVGGPIAPNIDFGTCTCPDTTTVRVTSDEPTRAWSQNEWDQTDTGRHGWLTLYSSSSGLNASVTAQVAANTALVPTTVGGTGYSDLTLASSIPNTTYTGYRLYGNQTGPSKVWREYHVTDPVLAAAMTTDPWERDYPIIWSNGSSTTVISSNICYLEYSASGSAPYQSQPMDIDTVDPDSGILVTARPVVMPYGDKDQNAIGGSSTTGIPANVHFIIGVNKGRLTATCPADSGSPSAPNYSGTYYTLYGKQETMFVQLDEWRDRSNQVNMNLYACELLSSVKDVVYEGSLPYAREIESLLTPMAAVNVVGDGYVTPWSSLALPVSGVEVAFHEQGIPAVTTSIMLSNRRAMASAAPYLHPPIASNALGSMSSGLMLDGSSAAHVHGGGGLHDIGGMHQAGLSGHGLAESAQAGLAASTGAGFDPSAMMGGMPMGPSRGGGGRGMRSVTPQGPNPLMKAMQSPGVGLNMATGEFTLPQKPEFNFATAGRGPQGVGAHEKARQIEQAHGGPRSAYQDARDRERPAAARSQPPAEKAGLSAHQQAKEIEKAANARKAAPPDHHAEAFGGHGPKTGGKGLHEFDTIETYAGMS